MKSAIQKTVLLQWQAVWSAAFCVYKKNYKCLTSLIRNQKIRLNPVSSFAPFQKIAERSRALLPPAQKDKRKVSWYGGWKSTLCFTVIHKRAWWWYGISLLDCILTRAPLKLCLVSSTLLYYSGLHSSHLTLMHVFFFFLSESKLVTGKSLYSLWSPVKAKREAANL